MDVLDAAVRVLEERREPLHWTVILDEALRRGYLDPFTERDLRARLLASLAQAARDPGGRIVKSGKGVYALR